MTILFKLCTITIQFLKCKVAKRMRMEDLKIILSDKKLQPIERLLLAGKAIFPDLKLIDLAKKLDISDRTYYRYRPSVSTYKISKKTIQMPFNFNTGELVLLQNRQYDRLIRHYKRLHEKGQKDAMDKANYITQLAKSDDDLQKYFGRSTMQQEEINLDCKSLSRSEISAQNNISFNFTSSAENSFKLDLFFKKKEQLNSWFYNLLIQNTFYSQFAADNLYYRAIDQKELTTQIIQLIKQFQELNLPFSEFSQTAFNAIFAKMAVQPAKMAVRKEDKPRTNRGQTEDKQRTSIDGILSLHNLSGLQASIASYIFNNLNDLNVTKPITIEEIESACRTTYSSAKKTIQRLESKKVIGRVESKAGRGGWTTYKLIGGEESSCDRLLANPEEIEKLKQLPALAQISDPRMIIDFCLFYALFPNKKDAKQAATTFHKLYTSPTYPGIAALLTGIMLQTHEREYHQIQTKLWMPCWKFPSTWLNAWSWDDGMYHREDTIEIALKKLNKKSDKVTSAMDLFNRMQELSK